MTSYIQFHTHSLFVNRENEVRVQATCRCGWHGRFHLDEGVMRREFQAHESRRELPPVGESR